MRAALIAVMVASTLAGCAGLQAADTRSAERALTAAGFEARPADSPEKLTHLQSLPSRKVLVQEQNGQRQYDRRLGAISKRGDTYLRTALK